MYKNMCTGCRRCSFIPLKKGLKTLSSSTHTAHTHTELESNLTCDSKN